MSVVRIEFGLNPVQDWVLTQQAQTMNLQSVGERTSSIPEERVSDLRALNTNKIRKYVLGTA